TSQRGSAATVRCPSPLRRAGVGAGEVTETIAGGGTDGAGAGAGAGAGGTVGAGTAAAGVVGAGGARVRHQTNGPPRAPERTAAAAGTSMRSRCCRRASDSGV